jgi:hypothetical protein
VIVALACPEHPDIYRAVEMGHKEHMRGLYAQLKKKETTS